MVPKTARLKIVMPELRIVDANLNRASEGLRVMEDAARLGLDLAELSWDIKSARHELRTIAGELARCAGEAMVWRDTPGDVGTGHSTTSERARAGLREVVIAAGKRTQEALRVLEEMSKVVATASTAAARCKALRYRVYELDRRLVLAMGSGRGRQWGVCVLVTESLCVKRSWERVVEGAIAGGAEVLQLREKEMEGRELVRRARRMVEMAKGAGSDAQGPRVTVFINDRPDVCVLSGADGVHLGQTDVSVSDARRIVGLSRLVGVSTTNMEQARGAVADGADCCGVGPMFTTTTKHKPVLAGPAYLRAYLAEEATARVPHLAIGGIHAGNIAELVAAGCRGVAVSSAVCSSEDPEEATRGLVRALARGESGAGL